MKNNGDSPETPEDEVSDAIITFSFKFVNTHHFAETKKEKDVVFHHFSSQNLLIKKWYELYLRIIFVLFKKYYFINGNKCFAASYDS